MFYTDAKLQYPVRVDAPNPLFAKMLQQAIGGVEGEIRVAMQYLFQAWGARGPKKYRDMLLATGTEELAHIEMLATAVALNLEGAPVAMQEEAARDSVVNAVLGGMNARHVLSAGLAATPEDANGNPFNASHVYASGNVAADMYANAMAEMTGRTLAVRLYNMTDDAGMKDMLQLVRGGAADPEQPPAVGGAHAVQLRVRRSAHRPQPAAGGAVRPIRRGTVAGRQGAVHRGDGGATG